MPLPLEGVRVLGQAIVWAGPYLTIFLADMGAEVIEIESPRHLNPTRAAMRHPPAAFAQTPFGAMYVNRDLTGAFWNRHASYNYGKRNAKSVAVDITRPEGYDLFLRLVAKSDIFVENNAAQVVEHLHIDYPDLVKVKPDLIMLRFPGFGITGPYRHFKGFGANVEAVVGHTHLRGYPDADPTQTAPVYHGDPTAGAHGAFAVLAALSYRRRTGKGQLIDMAQAEAVVNHLAHAFMDYSMNRRVQAPWGNRHPWMAPHNAYPCAGEDRWIAIAVPSDAAFAALCRVMGAEGLAQDPRFADGASRYRHQDELDGIIARWTRAQDNRALMETLQREGVPAIALADQREMTDDPHLKARGFFERVTHPEAGTHLYPGPVAKFSATPLHIRTPAPTLGQHNAEVFKGIVGLSDQEYDALCAAGILAQTYAEDAT